MLKVTAFYHYSSPFPLLAFDVFTNLTEVYSITLATAPAVTSTAASIATSTGAPTAAPTAAPTGAPTTATTAAPTAIRRMTSVLGLLR